LLLLLLLEPTLSDGLDFRQAVHARGEVLLLLLFLLLLEGNASTTVPTRQSLRHGEPC
jgi:hypothetical protein